MTEPTAPAAATDFTQLPDGLPVPVDDGAAKHVPGRPMPPLVLPGTDGSTVSLHELGPGRTVVYIYPLTGRPGVALPEGWDEIPGARGCSTEACDFRDHYAELLDAGVTAVFGLSSQSVDYQREAVQRLGLPYAMLSDPALELAAALGLPTFTAGRVTLYRRLTLIIAGGRIEHVFYPIFPPNRHAGEVLGWLRGHPPK
ncbi:MAG: peroxiredoxin [Solirubrobacterales bacterium]|nr:peroxiredoxin [Solirubrobacterales bacterium]MBV9716978.1 peroxiredoxin [Solirubrobacterales bacterium]